MKAVPPLLSGDYTSLSDHIYLDESQMSYGTKSSTSSDPKSVSNEFVSCNDSDKSLEVNTNEFASSDSSVKSSESKIKSNVGTLIQEPIIVKDLPSFSCNSSDKNENTSRTSCNKNGYFNKTAVHFKKNALFVSRLCFVCGSSTHLIKDCDFYEKHMVNKTVGIGVEPVNSRNKVNHQNQFIPQAVLLRTGKVNISPARPQPIPTGKPKVFAPVPTGRQNRPFPVPNDRGYSPSVISCWWKSTTGHMPYFSRPTSSYFQTYTPYVPTMYYNHMKYGGDRWATAVKPSAGCSWKSHRKGFYWENSFLGAEDEGVFDSSCSRSMTGNKERLDDFQEFQGRKVTFRGGEGRITGKGTIRTPTLDFKNVCYVKELQQFNLFSISQICDKKNRVLFTDTECLVLSKDFKLLDEKHKDETSPILKDFINIVENQLNKKVKSMRCNNGTEFKNAYIIELCGSKGIKREYSNARTSQQNKVTERKNKTLIEAATTMLDDSKLPNMFWTDVVRTACYVLNRVLVTSPHNMTPYALLTGNIPSVSHFKPFGCHVTILNIRDHLGKFDGKADEGYIVGYSTSNKAYRVYNVPNKRVEETMNLLFLEEKPNVHGLGHEWYFDLDYLTDTLGYKHVQANQYAGIQAATTNPAGACKAERASATTVPPGSIPVPTGSIPVPSGDTMVSPGDVPVHTSSPTDSFFYDEPTTRFLSPSDLGNHDPSPGIFSSSSYDDGFGATLNNVASTVEFKFQNVWVLIDLPEGKYAIGTKWILKNKRDDRGIVVRNNARLVAQGHRQEEGIDYDEVFAPVARIKAIRLFLDFASYMGFMVYQMDVKSAFLYGRIDEEVYVTQPKGLVDPQHPKKVYKVIKSLYGLHQAPRAWYATLSSFLLKHGYRRGTIDKTLFFKKNKRDIILGEFQMSAMGELTFFVGLQVQQRPDGFFINQDKSMIGSLMYLTTLRPNIMFTVSAYSRNQVTPPTSNLEAVKKIFKYLKGQPKLGLWYPKESPFVLKAYSDSDYDGANKDRNPKLVNVSF
nr:retrotransposon protein, putative, unclassified [Tanacetum cinerariifolium]